MVKYECPVCKDKGYVTILGNWGYLTETKLCPECRGDPDSLVSITDLKNELKED